MGDVEILFVSYQSDPNKVTQGYPAQVDTFPDTGPDTPGLQHPRPWRARSVASLTRLSTEGGPLIPAEDARTPAGRVLDPLGDEGLQLRMGREAAEDAARRFGRERMAGCILRFTGRTTKAKAYRLKRAILLYALPNPC